MTASYSAPELLDEIGKKLRFVSGYSRINEFTGLQFTYCGEEHQVSCGYTRTNGKNDFASWRGVALLFVHASQQLKSFLADSKFHVLHQVGILYVVRSGTLETEGELIADVIECIFGNKNYDSPAEWLRTVYPYQLIVAHDPPLILNNHTTSRVSIALPIFINDANCSSRRKLKEYFNETYKKQAVSEDRTGRFFLNTSEFPLNTYIKAPRFSEEDISNFLRILDQWIVNDVLHLEASETVISS